MYNKDYCDYNTSVYLNELGYNTLYPTRVYAGKGGVWISTFNGDPDYKEGEMISLSDMCGIPRDGNEVIAPSLYDAQKWLRKIKKLALYPFLLEKGKWVCLCKDLRYGFTIAIDIPQFNEYEDSLLNGIKEVVKYIKEGKYEINQSEGINYDTTRRNNQRC